MTWEYSRKYKIMTDPRYITAGEMRQRTYTYIIPVDTPPQNPVEGMLYANSTDHLLYYYDGTNWVAVGSSGGGSGATPGGDAGAIQFNNAGVFDGTILDTANGKRGIFWDPVAGGGGSVSMTDGWGGPTGNFSYDGSFEFARGAQSICSLNNSGLSMQGSRYLSTQAFWTSPLAIASLPFPSIGMICCVSDGQAGVALGSPVGAGGGTTKYLVWYNGTAWTVMGK